MSNILIKYYYKNGSGLADEHKLNISFKEAEKKAKIYNEDTSNELFIKCITDLNTSKPRYSKWLNYTSKELNKVRIKPQNGGLLEGSVWDNIYMIPFEDDELVF